MEFKQEELISDKFDHLPAQMIKIPLLLTKAEEVELLPKVLEDEKQLYELVHKYISLGRVLYEEEDDETIIKHIRNAIVKLYYLNPTLNRNSSEYSTLLKLILMESTLVQFENVKDTCEELDVELDIKVFIKRQELGSSIVTSCDGFEIVETMYPLGANAIKVGKDVLIELKDQMDDYNEQVEHLLQTIIEKSMCILFGQDVKYTQVLDESTLDEIYSHFVSPNVVTDIQVKLNKLELPNTFKKSFLVKRLINRINIGMRRLFDLHLLAEDAQKQNNEMNGILRLVTKSREIRKDGIYLNPIYKDQFTLDQAFKYRVMELNAVIQDIKVICSILSGSFEADENVQEYLEILQKSWDAEVLHLHFIKNEKTKQC